MKLRTAAFIGGVGLTTLVVVAVAISVWLVVDRSARRQVAAELDDSRRILADVMNYQQAQQQNDAQIIADEPRIKALFGPDLDIETIRGEAIRARERLGSGLLLMSDAEGYLLVDTDHPEDSGTFLLDNPVTGPVVSQALESSRGFGVWTTDSQVFRVQAQSIRFGQEVRGAILIGSAITDEDARTLSAQLGSGVVVTLDDQVVASSMARILAPADIEAVTGLANKGAPTREIEVGDRQYFATRVAFPGYEGDRSVGVALLQDLDAALAPRQRVLTILSAVFAGAVALAIALALLVSRRMSRPIDELVAFTHQVAEGNLSTTCEARGFQEVTQLAGSMNHMVKELAESRRLMAEKERLERELQIASRIQTSIVPSRPTLRGFQIATHMATADEVGGDYYDVIQTDEGGWIAIGDVSGHGLDAGLIMMMVQTAVASLIQVAPTASPSAVLGALNRVIFDNIHERLQVSRHMTLSLLHAGRDGQIAFAGAHMDILIRRADGTCETIETRGTWIGIADDITTVTADAQLALQPGDMMILYTDGVTEATDAKGRLFGLEGLSATALHSGIDSPRAMVEAIVEAISRFQHQQFDDYSIVVARRDA